MSQAVTIITDRVRDRVRRDGVDLLGLGVAERYVRDEVQRYSERALGGSLPLLADEGHATSQVMATLTGFGPLQPYFDDPGIEEIWMNSPDKIFVARDGIPELTDLTLTDGEVRDLVERMLQSSGRRVDLSSPFVDSSLPDGSRLHVVIPDITPRHWAVNIRKFTKRIKNLRQLVELGSLTQQSAEFLRMCVLSGQNILVSGATQSGKTTMLNALLSGARQTERIVTVEETFELNLSARDTVSMQCRQPSLEGTGEISLRRLIKEALRMRPDRLVGYLYSEVLKVTNSNIARKFERPAICFSLTFGAPFPLAPLPMVLLVECFEDLEFGPELADVASLRMDDTPAARDRAHLGDRKSPTVTVDIPSTIR